MFPMGVRNTSPFGFGIRTSVPFDVAVMRTEAAFKKEGFGVVSRIDIHQQLAVDSSASIPPYTVLGMCNPDLAAQAIAIEPEAGLFLPCNVTVRECADGIHVSALDPHPLFWLAEDRRMGPIADESQLRMERALKRIKGMD